MKNIYKYFIKLVAFIFLLIIISKSNFSVFAQTSIPAPTIIPGSTVTFFPDPLPNGTYGQNYSFIFSLNNSVPDTKYRCFFDDVDAIIGFWATTDPNVKYECSTNNLATFLSAGFHNAVIKQCHNNNVCNVHAIGQRTFNIIGTGQTTPTPSPTTIPTPIPTNFVNWSTQWASFSATDYKIQILSDSSNGKIFRVNPSKPCNLVTGEMVCVHSNPPGLSQGQHYMTLEVEWFEYDIEMRMYIYLYSDGQRWWSNEIRVYNGQPYPNSEWVYFYGKFFDSPVGQAFTQSNYSIFSSKDPETGNWVTLSFSNVDFSAFHDYFVPSPTSNPDCACKTNDNCTIECDFEKIASVSSYLYPIKCGLAPSLFSVSPDQSDKTAWCNRRIRTQGDADGNGIVNNFDYYYYIATVFGGKIPPNVNPDFNGDGEVGRFDLDIYKLATGNP